MTISRNVSVECDACKKSFVQSVQLALSTISERITQYTDAEQISINIYPNKSHTYWVNIEIKLADTRQGAGKVLHSLQVLHNGERPYL